ncbi:(2Fe-2S) ferredoxin domain-containing protein [Nocardioides sp. LHG3406-4]|uniref:(2Fe-2S) ferredoxin domain-containing protein n=1 Tax=Nocardioides sp. LHG3406-4 TaxID=2804575 RepID=UPI003CF18828
MQDDVTAPVVLVGMSVREVQARDLLHEVAHERGAGVAFLQMGDPSVSSELTRLADLGHERVVLVGVSLGSLAPAASWLRRIAGHWLRERPGRRPVVDVAARLAHEPAQVGEVLGLLRPVTGAEAGLESAAWEDVPGHRHQALICRGPRCTAKGSDLIAEAVVLELMRLGQTDDDVLITHTGCQFPCNRAPVVSVQPDDVWYGDVDPDAARQIVAEHLVGGHPVESVRLPRTRRTQGGDNPLV